MIKLKRGSYKTLTSNNNSIPYGQPVVGDVTVNANDRGQCGSVLCVGDATNSSYNSIKYKYYALNSVQPTPGIFVCDPTHYDRDVPYGILPTDEVDNGVVTVSAGRPTVQTTLSIDRGGTGATTASAAKSAIGLSNVVNERQYSAAYPPPYPVTKVNNKTGAVTLNNTDVGAVKNGGVKGQDENHQMAMSWNGNAIIVGVDNNAAVKTLVTTDDSRVSDSGFWAPWQSKNWVSDGSVPFVCYIRKIGHIIYYEFDLTAKPTINCTDESAAKLVTYNITDNSYKPNMTIYKMVTIINGSPLYFKFDPSGSEIRCFGVDIPTGTRLRGTWTWMGQ